MRRTTRRAQERTDSQNNQFIGARKLSALIGGILVLLALCWFIWLLARQLNPGLSVILPIPGFAANKATTTPSDPLISVGITLSVPSQSQQPVLDQRQALLLANQIEPAVQAKKVDAVYTLFSYADPHASQSRFHNVPVWLVHYIQISDPPPNTAADPHATSTRHDLYLVLDANSGKELLAVWL